MLDEQVKRLKETVVELAEAHFRAVEPDGEIVALAEELGAG